MDNQTVSEEEKPEIHIAQPESEYVIGNHGELRRRFPKPAPKAKNRVAAGIKAKNPNNKARRHHGKK